MRTFSPAPAHSHIFMTAFGGSTTVGCVRHGRARLRLQALRARRGGGEADRRTGGGGGRIPPPGPFSLSFGLPRHRRDAPHPRARPTSTCPSAPQARPGPQGGRRALPARGERARQAPFVAVNCAALAPELVDSALFGHEKGAFTGAHERRVGSPRPRRGHALLDEIGELDAGLQVQAAAARAGARVSQGGRDEAPCPSRRASSAQPIATSRRRWRARLLRGPLCIASPWDGAASSAGSRAWGSRRFEYAPRGDWCSEYLFGRPKRGPRLRGTRLSDCRARRRFSAAAAYDGGGTWRSSENGSSAPSASGRRRTLGRRDIFRTGSVRPGCRGSPRGGPGAEASGLSPVAEGGARRRRRRISGGGLGRATAMLRAILGRSRPPLRAGVHAWRAAWENELRQPGGVSPEGRVWVNWARGTRWLAAYTCPGPRVSRGNVHLHQRGLSPSAMIRSAQVRAVFGWSHQRLRHGAGRGRCRRSGRAVAKFWRKGAPRGSTSRGSMPMRVSAHTKGRTSPRSR